ncbi:unnamed protein product [Paramecium primaurelia]|uniref:Uncharacterized protein n=1 Tax=Paramecium primaurelia TaxID=5886 RepID=A0A8S1NUQ8_PARPR|nr:unnamed protein product [Paramecium primaurelia]CAD8090774.1 unnamed protein product [Paramecium primaurelia]
MGICMSNQKQRKEKQLKEGELDYIVKQMKTSPCPEEILNQRTSIDIPYNAYRNPILNRRLKESTTLTTAQ